MSTPEHSPLPWSRDHYDGIYDADGNRIGALNGAGVLVDELNARLVITATSSHAKLLAAAKEALHEINDDVIYRRLSAAIAVVEEPAP
jgi:hypothetical protein